MSPERFREIEKIYQAVLETPRKQRKTFLQNACGGDILLREEVETLLALDQTSNSLIDSPPDSLVAEIFYGEKSRK